MLTATQAGIDFDHDAAREELGLEPPSEEQLAAKAQATADLQARWGTSRTRSEAAGEAGARATSPAGGPCRVLA